MGFFIYSRYIKGPAIRGYYPIKRICDAYIFRQTNICNERHKEPMPFRRPGGRIHRPPRLREPTYRLCRILSRLLRENCVYNLKTHAVKKLKGAYLPKINETSRLPKKNNIYPHLLAEDHLCDYCLDAISQDASGAHSLNSIRRRRFHP